MGIEGTRLRGDQHAAGLQAARDWRIAMKPHFDALYGAEGDLRQGVTPAGHRVLDWLDETRSEWAVVYPDARRHLPLCKVLLDCAIDAPGLVTELDDLIDIAARLLFTIDQLVAAQPGTGAQA